MLSYISSLFLCYVGSKLQKMSHLSTPVHNFLPRFSSYLVIRSLAKLKYYNKIDSVTWNSYFGIWKFHQKYVIFAKINVLVFHTKAEFFDLFCLRKHFKTTVIIVNQFLYPINALLWCFLMPFLVKILKNVTCDYISPMQYLAQAFLLFGRINYRQSCSIAEE